MSNVEQLQSYYFSKDAQWDAGVIDRLGKTPNGLQLHQRLGTTPETIELPAGTCVTAVAVDPRGRWYWADAKSRTLFWSDDRGQSPCTFRPVPLIASSRRLVVDRLWLWSFDKRHVYRHVAQTLDMERAIPIAGGVLDIAGDHKGGLWVLTRGSIVHIDKKGVAGEAIALPKDGPSYDALVSVSSGGPIALLSKAGDVLQCITEDGMVLNPPVQLSKPGSNFVATGLATDGHGRIAVIGGTENAELFIIDRLGAVLEGKIEIKRRSPEAGLAVAFDRSVVLIADGGAIFVLSMGGKGAPAAEGAFMTPPLTTLDRGMERGWLRAEINVTLPPGSKLEVETYSTADELMKTYLAHVAKDPSVTTARKFDAVFGSQPGERRKSWVFAAAERAGVSAPIAIPLFNIRDRFLWLKLRLVAAPGNPLPVLHAMRVIYPDISLMRNVPSIFHADGDERDPLLRQLVGVLEATTQRIDEDIAGLARNLDPMRAPAAWLDFMAAWLDLPWHNALSPKEKQCLLQHAEDLTRWRGTARGLEILLKCLCGDAAVRHVDPAASFELARVGGEGCAGSALPALLGGATASVSTLRGRASLGRVRLPRRGETDRDVRAMRPTLIIEIAAPHLRRTLEAILAEMLPQFVPAGLKVRIKWQARGDLEIGEGHVLEGRHPGRLGRDSLIGQTIVAGRTSHLLAGGFDPGVTLQ